jgi:hypothetical protein
MRRTSSLNATQKVAIFLAFFLIVCVAVLHSPWSGYVTEKTGYFLLNTYFSNEGDLPFWQWHTVAPLLLWFASLLHVAIAVSAILMLALLWCYLFRSSQPAAPPQE